MYRSKLEHELSSLQNGIFNTTELKRLFVHNYWIELYIVSYSNSLIKFSAYNNIHSSINQRNIGHGNS